MNWSLYSRYVGDIFGAPLAMEGLMAFFLESTFIGLWIFGWGRLSPKLHLATPGCRLRHGAVGLLHPRRQLVDAAPGRLQAQPGDPPRGADQHLRGAVQLDGAARLPAHDLRRLHDRRHARARDLRCRACSATRRRRACSRARSRAGAPAGARRASPAARSATARAACWTTQQPMKMAAAEALYNTTKGASLSLFAVGPFEHHPKRAEHRHPHPARALADRDAQLERHGAGHQPDQRAGAEEVRPGRLRADRRRDLLVASA